MRKTIHVPGAAHRAFREDAIALLTKHSGHLPAREMLAMAAHLVGQVIAMQDQTAMTQDVALGIVQLNIEQGNREMLENLMKTKGAS